MKKRYLNDINTKHIKMHLENVVVKRIEREENRIKNKIIAVDFDGTIVSNNYPQIGTPNYELINRLKFLSRNNTLILWTCRNGKKLREAVEYCENLGLKFDYVNENSKEILKLYCGVDSRKITADVYIDDKARRRI